MIDSSCDSSGDPYEKGASVVVWRHKLQVRVPRISQKLQSKKMSSSKSDQAFGGKEVWN